MLTYSIVDYKQDIFFGVGDKVLLQSNCIEREKLAIADLATIFFRDFKLNLFSMEDEARHVFIIS